MFHLHGAFTPVAEERSETSLEVRGALPVELCGTYVRNGPNPRSGHSPAWFAAEGMLHAVRIERGQARWYRNRWIDGPRAPNTSVVRHAGRLLALVEALPPIEVSPTLETIGPYDFGGALPGPMTAHPKLCPRSGELHFFAQSAARPHLTYYRADAAGRVVHRVPIDVPALTFMHDFAITQRHVVFYVLPVLFGDLRSAVPLCWDPSFPARVGILPRDGFQDDMRWFDVAPCTISHTVNAFEDGASVVLDAVRAPRPLVAHTLHRFTFDLDRGSARESTLDPRFLDFPRVHPHYVGARHRFVYSTELCDFGRDGSFSKTRAHRHDLQLQRSLVHEFGEDWMPGEAVVIPRADRRDEQAAWIMLFVHARDGSQTELVVLDAEHFSAPPLARVRIPGRVPYGLHGAWLADDE